MEQEQPGTIKHKPVSSMLEEILDQAPADFFTLEWLIGTLHQRSFFILMSLLALLATSPVGSSMPGLILAVLAIQMIAGRREPAFPDFIVTRPLPTRYLLWVGQHAIPVLKWLEKLIYPRWRIAFETTKPITGIMVLLLTGALLLTPVPLSNVAPAALIVVMALASIEEDGLLLAAALVGAIFLIGTEFVAVWGAIVGTALISDL
jgi:hypothetical protein